MARFKKGSKEAKAYMAKIRGKKTTSKKPIAKKTVTKKLNGLDKVVRKGKNTSVHYTRISGIISGNMYNIRDQIERDIKSNISVVDQLKKDIKKPNNKALLLKVNRHLSNLKKSLREQNKLISSALK